jgi:hypothetical protein
VKSGNSPVLDVLYASKVSNSGMWLNLTALYASIGGCEGECIHESGLLSRLVEDHVLKCVE